MVRILIDLSPKAVEELYQLCVAQDGERQTVTLDESPGVQFSTSQLREQELKIRGLLDWVKRDDADSKEFVRRCFANAHAPATKRHGNSLRKLAALGVALGYAKYDHPAAAASVPAVTVPAFTILL